MQASSIIMLSGAILLLSPNPSYSESFKPYGFQSGTFKPATTTQNHKNADDDDASSDSEYIDDDTFAGSMYFDAQHNLIFFTGSTYGTYFDGSPDDGVLGGSPSDVDSGAKHASHLVNSDCFLGVLKLPPRPSSSNGMEMGSNQAPWLIHIDDETAGNSKGPELIYARRFGTVQNSEACSSIMMLPKANDALLRNDAQLKLTLLGHVTPEPDYFDAAGGGERRRRLNERHQPKGPDGGQRELQSNSGGFLHSISNTPNSPVVQPGRSYGFALDFDLSLATSKSPSSDGSSNLNNAYGALLGGHVLESSPLVYPVAMTQNKRDANEIYVVSMHSEDEKMVHNPEYFMYDRVEADGTMHDRADTTLGGAGGNFGGGEGVGGGGVPKYGSNFYVKVQQLTVTPYEELMDVEPTADEGVKQTMTSGWGFGFKLNDANDVRPSAIVFVKGRTPDEDLLLLGGTTRKNKGGRTSDGDQELDGFVTKLIVPAPSPIPDETTGHTVEDAIEDESVHPTKRIDSTTGRDETVTAICLPPPDSRTGVITHAFVVGCTTASSDESLQSAQGGGHVDDPSNLAYILKMRLTDLSTVWKTHVHSIHPAGLGGGDVLGEGCAVSPDGKFVYLGGTIDGGSALNAGVPDTTIRPVGGTSDVFVVGYDTEFGNVQWSRQFGTVYEDKLARGSGGITTDDDGNVIVMGSTRGGLQRSRPEKMDKQLASDVFIMSLSKNDGGYINAPFAGSGSESGGQVTTSASNESGPIEEGVGGLSPGAISGVSLIVIGIAAALLFVAVRHRHAIGMRIKRRRQRYYDKGDDVQQMWEDNGGDDFSENRRSRKRGGGGESLRIIRGADDDNESVSRNATWMSGGGGGGGVRRSDSSGSGSIRSTGSSGSKGSYTDKKTSENVDFISSLRNEANATMKRMMDSPGSGSDTTDPRLDDGASIKSLLSHYREVKKGGLMEGNDGDGSKKEGEGKQQDNDSQSSQSADGKKSRKGRPPPPPPPPRRNKNDDQSPASPLTPGSTDGLSEFTIV